MTDDTLPTAILFQETSLNDTIAESRGECGEEIMESEQSILTERFLPLLS